MNKTIKSLITIILLFILATSSVFATEWKEIEDKDFYKVEQSEECYLSIKECDDGLFVLWINYYKLGKNIFWESEFDRIMFIYDYLKSLDDFSYENIRRLGEEWEKK